MGMGKVNVYESPVLRDITGPAIRPGGFRLTDRGLAYCDLAPKARVLDIGCGTGAAADYLRRCRDLSVMGLDLSAVLLAKGGRTYVGCPLVQGRAEELPVSGGSLEAVLCECVLSLCAKPLNTLREVMRVLQPGGYLVLTDVYSRRPSAAVPAGKPSGNCCLQGAVTRSAIEDCIAAAGYDLLLWEDHSTLLKQLAAQLVWTYGSLDAFWMAIAGPDAAGVLSGAGADVCGRPGYYLLVAQKPAGNNPIVA